MREKKIFTCRRKKLRTDRVIKIRKVFFLCAFFVLTISSTAFSQEGKYKQRTLAEVTFFNRDSTDEILKKSKLEDKHDFIGVDPFYSKVRVRFMGQSRPISSDHNDLIRLWGKLQNVDNKIIGLYEEELLFKECDTEYWIPVQKKNGETIMKKVKQNEMITLFVVHLGGRKASMSKDFDWLFLAIAFEN